MQILLFILKVIGVILLVLLGMIGLVLTLLLFVPIRYEANGEIEDEYKIEAGGVIRYLFSILKITVAYRNGELETDVYFFGFRKRKRVLEESESLGAEEVEESKEPESNEEIETVKEDYKTEDIVEDIKVEVTKTEGISEPKVKTKPDSSSEIHSDALAKPKAKSKKEKSSKKVKSVKPNSKEENKFPFDLIKRELTDEHNHNVLKKALRELKYLLSHFGFRKIKTDLYFGLGDPALTGQILGGLAMFPLLYRYEFGITPDFETENAYIKGSFAIIGRVRLVHLLITACRLLFDKEVRLVVKKFMDMRNQ